MTTPPARRSAYSLGSVPNMLRSLLVIGLLVAAVVLIAPRVTQVERPAVDARAKAAWTASQTGWPIELPTGLGDDWVPTVATYAAAADDVPTFTSVWSTPSGGDIAVKEAVAPTRGWVDRNVGEGEPVGAVPVEGRVWEQYANSGRQQQSYLLRGEGEDALTIVVTSAAPADEAQELLASLRVVPPAS